jgi:hypothetical protein
MPDQNEQTQMQRQIEELEDLLAKLEHNYRVNKTHQEIFMSFDSAIREEHAVTIAQLAENIDTFPAIQAEYTALLEGLKTRMSEYLR